MPTITLTDQELDTVVTALDKLPTADMAGEMMVDLFSIALTKPEKDMTPEELEREAVRKTERDKKKVESQAKREDLKKEIEIVKAKILVQRLDNKS